MLHLSYQQNVGKPRRFDIGRKFRVFLRIRQLVLDDVEPREPLVLVVIRPDGRILRPNPRNLTVLAPFGERCLQCIVELFWQ